MVMPSKEGLRLILILDNASWHKSARLGWQHLEPKFLLATPRTSIRWIDRGCA